MGPFTIWHFILILLVLLLLLGGHKKFFKLIAEFAKGISGGGDPPAAPG